MLRFNDVHCTLAILSIREETPTHRLGIYFLEIGYDICLSKLNYCYGDRVRPGHCVDPLRPRRRRRKSLGLLRPSRTAGRPFSLDSPGAEELRCWISVPTTRLYNNEEKVVYSMSTDTFDPEQICPKGQIIIFLYRAFAG